MDAGTLHLLISAALGLLGSVGAFFIKTLLGDLRKVKDDLAAHKLQDAQEFGKLNAQNDEIMRALDDIKHSVEKLGDKMDRKNQ